MELLDWARACFANDRYATEATGISIQEVQADGNEVSATCGLTLGQHHRNARGAVMGGVFFTLADFACAVAMNLSEALPRLDQNLSQEELFSLYWVSLNSNINFLAQPKGSSITAKAVCKRKGRTTALYEIEIKEGERLLAAVTTTGMKIK